MSVAGGRVLATLMTTLVAALSVVMAMAATTLALSVMVFAGTLGAVRATALVRAVWLVGTLCSDAGEARGSGDKDGGQGGEEFFCHGMFRCGVVRGGRVPAIRDEKHPYP